MKLVPAKEALRGVFVRMRANLEAAGQFPPPPRKGPKPTDAGLVVF